HCIHPCSARALRQARASLLRPLAFPLLRWFRGRLCGLRRTAPRSLRWWRFLASLRPNHKGPHVEAHVPRAWLRRSRRGLWYSVRDVPPERLRRVVTFAELALAATTGATPAA